ncbi:hypothetical protein TeGR_g10043 [Tetraparma gracilis]|uniref:Uncharacterized protein n=1 Tax=Tetraparma gracilis TaxID=2962635 RepID=A0ABQ6NCX7_9STRA|nr:hypothetical protein TeGR_g10043 [Tetraparma gracilis]
MVDENVLSILLDACKPLFYLVSGTDDPDSKNSTMKPADLLMSTAKLIIAAGFKMKEQARQDMAEEDLGGGMFDQDVKEDVLTEKILDMIRSTNVLRSAQAKYRFLDEFIHHIVRNKMKLGASQTSFVVKTHLVALTASEAGRIARSFPMVMMANTTAAAAVDEFIMTYQALSDLDREYVWFRPMLTAIAKELMSAVVWGVKFRAYLGAVVSAADALSDAYMIKTFYEMGETGTANGLVAMVCANLAFQSTIVCLQAHGLKKDKWKTMLFEMLTVVSFVKPGVDAHRVASGTEQAPGTAIRPLMEMTYTKAGELFFEAIPGLVLQLVALLNAEETSNVAVGSIMISTASTALTATTMFWDWDTDPGNRKSSPDW